MEIEQSRFSMTRIVSLAQFKAALQDFTTVFELNEIRGLINYMNKHNKPHALNQGERKYIGAYMALNVRALQLGFYKLGDGSFRKSNT